MKTLPTNPSIRKRLRAVEELQDLQDSVMQQLFFHKKISIKEKIEYIQCLASAKADLWEEINATYPEVKGKSASATMWNISYDDEIEAVHPTP